MTLAVIEPVIGPPEQAQADHADCGTLAGNAWLQAFNPTIPSLPRLDNTFNYQVADAINALTVAGLRAFAEVPADLNAYLAEWLPQNVGLMAAVVVNAWDTSLNPSGTAKHWIDPFLVDAAGVHYYNCWTATADVTTAATLQASYAAAGGVGCVRITYEEPMNASDAYGAAQVSLAVILGHAPSMDEVTQMQNDIVQNGWNTAFNNAAARAASGGEIPLTERLQYLKMDGNSGPAQHSHAAGGTVQAHTHPTPAATTGPAQ